MNDSEEDDPSPYSVFQSSFNSTEPKKPKTTLQSWKHKKSIPKPQQVHFHQNDHSPDNLSTETSTQTMVHECLSDGGMDPI